MDLNQVLDQLLATEGGYSNNPADAGGETMYGITVAVARAYGYMGPMQSMPRSIAISIYTERYWKQPGFDRIAVLSQPIASELLDTGVNMGPATASRFLQRALNVLNAGDLYANLGVDGQIGNMTIAALLAWLNKRGAQGETVLLRMLNAQQSVRYIELAEAKASQKAFEFGWQLNRVGAL